MHGLLARQALLVERGNSRLAARPAPPCVFLCELPQF